MASIPVDRIPSVTPDGALPYQSVPNATPDAFGAGLGASLQQAGDTASDIALRQQAIISETNRVNAQNDLEKRLQDLQNGNQDTGIVGYRTMLGTNATKALPDYQQKVQDAYQQVRDGLSPAEQRMFDPLALRTVRGTTDAMGQWSSQQAVVGMHAAARAAVDVAKQGALTYADDPDGWAKHLSDVQVQSVDSSNLLGLPANAVEAQRARDVSDVYAGRTKQLMLRDPIEAADFYQKNIGSIIPDQRYDLERALNVTTNAQHSRGDADSAYKAAVGQPSASPAPQNFNAPDLPPIDPGHAQQVASFVKSSTPWDRAIANAGYYYNVNPNEIKLKIGMESGGNASAVNPTSGTVGLGQFTADTAARYGVTDRTDPVQSIWGIAKMLAANGGTTGSDMAGADRAYYGGNAQARGPNTDQYVENTRVVRQALFGGGAPAPLSAAQLDGKEADVISSAQAYAESRRPGDAVYRDQVVNDAHALWARDVQALRGRDYANFSQVLDASLKTGATSLSDLPLDVQQTASQLPPQYVEGMNAQFDRNLRQANGEYTKSDPRLVNDLTRRIYLPDGDPQRIVNPGQLFDYMGKGLNYADQQRLAKEIQTANTPEGNPFMKQADGVKEYARKMLTTSMSSMAVQHPEMAEEAAYRFGADLDAKVKAMRAAHQDPQQLFTPGNPNYMLEPSRVLSFMPSEADVIAAGARATAAAPPAPVPKRLPGETPADYLKRTGMQ